MITNKELPALIKRAHDNATAHGFHDKPKSAAHWLMLIITEISEMVDADRKGKHADRVKFEANNKSGSVINKDIVFQVSFERYIKDSVEDELADICIRIFDFAGEAAKYCVRLDVDKVTMEIGIIGTITEHAYTMVNCITDMLHYNNAIYLTEALSELLKYVFYLADSLNIPLLYHIEQKMKYNELRPFKHGVAY